MRREKKLFLLAMLTLLMSTEGYSANIKNTITGEVVKNEDISVGKNEEGYRLNSKQDSVTNLTVGQGGNLTVNGGVGIKYNPTSSNIKATNNGNIIVSGGIGVDLYMPSGKNLKNSFFNNNKIKVKDGIGIKVGVNGEVTNESQGTIEIKDGTGIFLNNGTSKFTNKGTLTVINGVGIDGTGAVINEKSIKLENGIGINLKNGKATNESQGTIEIKGGTGIVLNHKNSEFTNKGTVIVTQGIGIDLKDGKATNELQGTIETKGGTGIVLNNKNSEFMNKGTIAVEGQKSIGIIVNNGTANNNGTIKIGGNKGADQYSVGMKASSGDVKSSSQAINNNLITITGNGTTSNGMVAEVSKGKGKASITNNGTIQASKVNVSAMAAKGKGATATNEKNGTIIILEDATGMKIESEAVGINNGQIKISKGTGATVNGGNFTNEGIITVEGQKSIGINVSNGAADNKGTIIVGTKDKGADQYSVGMKAYSGDNKSKSEAINSKSITIVGNGKDTANAMAAEVADKVSGTASIKNNGTIEASGKSVSAMAAKRKGAMAINETKGVISVFDAATGMKIEENANGINKGEININNPNAIGVTLSNGSFINEGTIKAGKNGIAIKSVKGNNFVRLKNGSSIEGKILGANGIDVLAFEGTKDGKKYENLYVENYEVLKVVNGNVEINNSKIELEYNKGTKEYSNKVDEIIQGDKTVKVNSTGNLEMSGSNLVIDFKDSLTDKKLENPIIDVGKDGKLTFSKGMKFDFNSSDGRDEFNLNEALGLRKDQIIIDGNFDEVFKDTAVWEYDNTTGEIILKKNKYENIVLKPQIKKFAGMLEKEDVFNKNFSDKLKKIKVDLNLLDTKEEFTNALTQMSGGVHGYAVDFAAINARTMVNTMRERALTRDYLRNRPINSWTQDIMYVDNNHRLGGLMDVNYNEKGVLGISEKQILKNGRLGLVYGGTNGNAKFEGGENGSIKLDGAYFGGYYNHEFNPNWSLNSNVNFVYTHDRVTRNVKFADINETFKSSYPTYTVGLGSSLIYTVKDDLKNKAHFYAGIDVERLMIGNINENIDQEKDTTGLAVKTNSGGEKTYYSIVPSAGFMVQNTGYVFDKKYRIGADLNWETEVGDIKDGKRLSLTGINGEYKVETSKRENVFSYSLFGALDLTEDLAINAKYTSMFSDEYNSDMIGAGFEYKIDTMADNVFGNFAHKLENSRPFSDRWGGTLGVMLEAEDGNDVTYYSKPGGFPTSGDYATSTQYKPKMTLSLNDKKSNWGYYFETYYKNNSMLQGHKAGEEKQHASRIHGEVRWSDTYSRGKYGVNVGYRNEKSKKPNNSYQFWGRTSESAVHELRITPNFSYNLTNNITFGGKTTFVASYNYDGDRKDQTDFTIENQYGISYSGFMPRWQLSLIYFREDTFYDNSFRKVTGYDKKTDTYKYGLGSERYQNNQLRPSITYNFGNGAILKFDTRITLGNGSWYNEKDTHIKKSESYETRYSFDYSYPVAPGFTVNFGGSFLNMKSKSRTKDNYGNISRSYSFRPNIGFSYSF